MSNFEAFLDSLPDYAKDIKLNAKSLLVTGGGSLSAKQLGICAITSAITTKNANLIQLIEDFFAPNLSAEELFAARGCAAIMGMNNVYYRFLHLTSNQDYKVMQPGLRMSIIASHGIENKDFELAALAASAITGCGLCVDSHEKKLKNEGFSGDAIQQAVKIAAVIHGLSCVNN